MGYLLGIFNSNVARKFVQLHYFSPLVFDLKIKKYTRQPQTTLLHYAMAD